jgi:predicted PurR-regulated permease PerM
MNSHNADDSSRDRLLGRITALLLVVVIALVVTLFYFASSLCITIVLASFLAILVEPAAALLEKLRVPRTALVVASGMILVSAAFYVFYEKAAVFRERFLFFRDRFRVRHKQ